MGYRVMLNGGGRGGEPAEKGVKTNGGGWGGEPAENGVKTNGGAKNGAGQVKGGAFIKSGNVNRAGLQLNAIILPEK